MNTTNHTQAAQPANPYQMAPERRRLLNHISMHGSDGYPISKVKSGWCWGTDTVKGAPVVFATKAQAVESFERFYDVLVEDSGAEAAWRAGYEAAQRGTPIGDDWCDAARQGFEQACG